MVSFSLMQSGGNLNLYSIARTSDQSVIKIPFRMLNLKYSHDYDRFSISSSFSLEYDINFETSDSDYLVNSSPQDRIWKVDLRELYFTWFLDAGEIRFGKQIFAWGMVDENSPIDNVNAFDYFYLFELGADRKLGSYSLSFEYSFQSFDVFGVVSPYHSTSRLPLGDSEFPIKVPLYPDPKQIFLDQDVSPIEFGGYIQKGFEKGDLQFSYFSGLDRIFNLSAISTWKRPEDSSQGQEYSTIAYSYRKTDVLGLGFNYFLNDLTFRGDFGLFSTKDMNNNLRVAVSREDFPDAFEVEKVDGAVPGYCVPDDFDGTNFIDECYLPMYTEYVDGNSSSLEESADYYQMALQLEYGLPFNINFGMQYIRWDLINYSANKLGITIEQLSTIPLLEGSPILDLPTLDPELLFSPGLGTPNAVLSKELFVFNAEKFFLNEDLKVSFLSMLDFQHLDEDVMGSIINLTAEYNFTENFIPLVGLTIIKGDSSIPFYRFNDMEDFSHFRCQLKYYF